jgi:arsenate reductase-like glutaredoxin family protein
MVEEKKVEFYGLSTCGWCRKAREWLDAHEVSYSLVYLDLAADTDKEAAKERALKFVSRLSVPIVIINDGERVIQGYKPEEYEAWLS